MAMIMAVRMAMPMSVSTSMSMGMFSFSVSPSIDAITQRPDPSTRPLGQLWHGTAIRPDCRKIAEHSVAKIGTRVQQGGYEHVSRNAAYQIQMDMLSRHRQLARLLNLDARYRDELLEFDQFRFDERVGLGCGEVGRLIADV